MIRLLSRRKRTCDGATRREALVAGGLSLFGMTVPDALKLAKAVEGMNIMWLEDMITGDYTPYVLADLYKQVTPYTTTPIHTGEQIYLRQNFVELIETSAVNILGPDPADVGGLAEMKFIAEYADLHGIMFAPHGRFDGLIGLAAHVQLAASLPDNYIAFELPNGDPDCRSPQFVRVNLFSSELTCA